MYINACEIAGRMLGCDAGQLHYKFVEYLVKIESYIKIERGALFSRQLIAKAIVDWEMITGERAKSE